MAGKNNPHSQDVSFDEADQFDDTDEMVTLPINNNKQ